MFDSNQRIKTPKNLGDSASSAKIKAGLLDHILVDKIFHNSEYFKSQTKVLQNGLGKMGFVGLTRHHYFFAHILLEILLDRYLIEQYPSLIQDFYTLCGEITEDDLNAYFKEEGYSLAPKEFYTFFEWFCSSQFMYSYTSDVGVTGIFNSIHKRVFKTEVLKEDAELFTSGVEELYLSLLPDGMRIFSELEAVLQQDSALKAYTDNLQS